MDTKEKNRLMAEQAKKDLELEKEGKPQEETSKSDGTEKRKKEDAVKAEQSPKQVIYEELAEKVKEVGFTESGKEGVDRYKKEGLLLELGGKQFTVKVTEKKKAPNDDVVETL